MVISAMGLGGCFDSVEPNLPVMIATPEVGLE